MANIERLKTLLRQTDSEVIAFLKATLEKDFEVFTDEANYIFGVPKGDSVIPVCLCAHIDTRRTAKDEPVALAFAHGTVFNENGILGADDRAGIAICLDVCDTYPTCKPYLLFTTGEEIGGTGMKEFIRTSIFRRYLDDIYLTVSVDRRGHNEYCVYMDDTPEELSLLLLTHGYFKNFGSFSDGKLLWEAYDVANVNVSAGYANQHTADEFLLLESFFYAVGRLARFITSIRSPLRVRERLIKVNGVYKLVGPEDYNGMGTAKAEPLGPPWREEPHVPVHCPPSIASKLELSTAPAPRCFVCDRNDRPTEYHYPQAFRTCRVCRDRIIKHFGVVNVANALKYKQQLERMREKSREANRLTNNKKSSRPMPLCPCCKDNRDVVWSEIDKGYKCMSCAQNPKKSFFNGMFWLVNSGKDTAYHIGKQIFVTEIKSDKRLILRRVEPCSESVTLKKCEVCGTYHGNCITVYTGKDGNIPRQVCSRCLTEVTHTLLSDKGGKDHA